MKDMLVIEAHQSLFRFLRACTKKKFPEVQLPAEEEGVSAMMSSVKSIPEAFNEGFLPCF